MNESPATTKPGDDVAEVVLSLRVARRLARARGWDETAEDISIAIGRLVTAWVHDARKELGDSE